MASAQTGAISKKRKFVADGVFYAELNEFFQRELAEEGYSGVEVRVTPTVTDISKLYRNQRSLCFFLLTMASHPCNTHPRSSGRTRPTHSRTHLLDPKTLQVSRKLRLPVCSQGSEPWSFCRCSMRVSPIQASQWTGCAKSVLRCPSIHHGEWSQGM